MGKRKVLIVSWKLFCGGGEILVGRVFFELETQFEVYYEVRNRELYEKLITDKKYFLDGSYSFLDEIRFARQLLIENRIDMVLLNGNRAIYMAPFLPRKVKKVAYKHTSAASTPWFKRGMYYVLMTLGFWFSRKIVGVSRMVVDEIKGFHRKKVVIYNGVPIPKELRREEKKVIQIVYAGRIEREKGIIEAVEAVLQLSDYPIILKIAGTGSLEAELRSMIQQNGSQNIVLLGHVNDVEALLVDSDIFILPTYYEAISLSVLEAMACSLPVLATNVGGIPEAVKDGETGILVAPRNVSLLKDGLKELLENSKMRVEMGRKGRERAIACFDIRKTINEVAQLFKNIER